MLDSRRMDAILSMPRSPERVAADLRAHQHHRAVLFEMAGDLAAMQMPPIFVVAGEVIERAPVDLPPALVEAIRDEQEQIVRLEYELRDARTLYQR